MSELYNMKELTILYGVPGTTLMGSFVLGGELGHALMVMSIFFVLFIALVTANNLHRRIEQLENAEEGDSR